MLDFDRSGARAAFLRGERAALHRFMERFTMGDFLGPAGVYSRSYKCDCGFATTDSDVIYDHCEQHPAEANP